MVRIKKDKKFDFNIHETIEAVIAIFVLVVIARGFSFDNSLNPISNIFLSSQIPSMDRNGPINLVSPNTEEVWKFGSIQTIRWTGGWAADFVNIDLINESNSQLFRTLLFKTANDGEEKWMIDIPPGSYKLQIQGCPGCSGGSSWDRSEYAFRVVADEEVSNIQSTYLANQSLVLAYPIGGEIIRPGSDIDIKWYSNRSDWQLRITLIPAGGSNSQNILVGEGIANDGDFSWSVPSWITTGYYYLYIDCSNCTQSPVTSAYSFFTFKIENL